MEESNNMAVSGEVNTPQVSPTEETTPDVAPESSPEEVVMEETSEVSNEAPEQSDRAKNRFQDLANKVKEKDAELNSLREQLGKNKPGDFLDEDTPSYEPASDKEITFEDYQKHVMSAADNLVKQRMKQYVEQSERIQNFEKGVNALESKYPELNPDSENYDDNLSDTITKLYQKSSKANPDLNVVDFVDSVMNLRTSGMKKGQETASAALAKQEASQAVTPSSDSPSRESSEDKLLQALKDGSISAAEAEKIIGLAD